jgi:hypothetical protein
MRAILMKLSLVKAWSLRALQVILTSVRLIGVGAIAVFTLAISSMAGPWPGLVAQATAPTPIATPKPAPTPPLPASPPADDDRPTTERLPVTEPSPTPAPPPAARQSSPSTQAGGPYDMQAIEEFYKSLYGS